MVFGKAMTPNAATHTPLVYRDPVSLATPADFGSKEGDNGYISTMGGDVEFCTQAVPFMLRTGRKV